MSMQNAESKKKRGQAMVEFALVLPIFLLLLTGILEFGLFFNSYIDISFSSREGARIAALDTNSTTATITSSVKATLPSSTAVEVTVTPSPPRVTGSPVAVTVSTQHSFITPLIASMFPSNPYTITSTTSMRSE